MEPINVDLPLPLAPPRRGPRPRRMGLRSRVFLAAFLAGGLVGAAIILVADDLQSGDWVTGLVLACLLVPLALLAWYFILARLTALRWGALTHLTADDSGLKLTWSVGGLEYRPWSTRASRFRVIFRKRPGPNFDRGFLAFPYRQEAEYGRIDGLRLLESARSKNCRIAVRNSRRRHFGRATVYVARAPR